MGVNSQFSENNNISAAMKFLPVTVCLSMSIPILSMAMARRQGDMEEVDEEEYQEVYTTIDTTEKHLDMKETEHKDHADHNQTSTNKKTKNATKEEDETSEDEVKDTDKDYHETEPVISAWDGIRFIDFQVWTKLNRFADGQKLVLALRISILALLATMVC